MASYLTPGVYIEEVPSGSASLSTGATAVAAFVGFTERAPQGDHLDPSDPEGVKPRLVTSWSQFEDLYGGFTPGAMLPHSVYGWFLNGGSTCYIVRIPHNQPSEEPGQLALPAADRALGEALEFTSIGPGDGLSISIEAAEGEPTEDGSDPEPTFDLNVLQDGVVVESYAGLSLAGDNNVVDTLTEHSERVKVATKVELTEDLDLMMAMPKAGLYPIEPAPREPLEVRTPTFAGSETKRQGINGLVIADDVTIVAVPDLITAATKDGTVDRKMWKAVQTALINHCEAQANRMAVLDAPPGMGVQEIKEWREDVAMYDSPFATMYYPWIKVSNPIGTNGDSEILVPPSGHMAGLWARVDESRGVWKAPANEVVRGALDVERPITKAEQGLLNPIGINCIRPFGTRGIRAWGARTLAPPESDWRYVNVRRLFNTVEQTIMNGTQWVVFEPNDVKLWEGVKRTLNAYLRGLWTSGALVGATAEQAFFVKCDAENNPPESIDEGKLIIEVGIAPVKPAEFVIFRISQLKETAA